MEIAEDITHAPSKVIYRLPCSSSLSTAPARARSCYQAGAASAMPTRNLPRAQSATFIAFAFALGSSRSRSLSGHRVRCPLDGAGCGALRPCASATRASVLEEKIIAGGQIT